MIKPLKKSKTRFKHNSFHSEIHPKHKVFETTSEAKKQGNELRAHIRVVAKRFTTIYETNKKNNREFTEFYLRKRQDKERIKV